MSWNWKSSITRRFWIIEQCQCILTILGRRQDSAWKHVSPLPIVELFLCAWKWMYNKVYRSHFDRSCTIYGGVEMKIWTELALKITGHEGPLFYSSWYSSSNVTLVTRIFFTSSIHVHVHMSVNFLLCGYHWMTGCFFITSFSKILVPDGEKCLIRREK